MLLPIDGTSCASGYTGSIFQRCRCTVRLCLLCLVSISHIVCVCVCAYMPIADTDIVGYTFGYLAVFMYESK